MYNHIAANKRKTWFLIALVAAVLIALFWLLGTMYGLEVGPSIALGTVVSTVFTLFSYYQSDTIALATSGAKQVTKDQAPELWNLVENLTIANGMPMPKVHVINDDALNAFATGRDPEHASIAFTTGLLRSLNKTELEGVAAHELSHVKNYDIRVMTIVVVLIGAVMLVADILLRSTMFRGRDDKSGNVGLILFFLGLALAILSPLFAELIKLAVSRSREYLADSSGALLTRYPEGLASALEKIAAAEQPMRRANHATAHLFIANPFAAHAKRTSWFGSLFSTHPPIDERIARLRSMGT
ncbi:M48 family metallopeptidase [Candidatus Uhrbacteria bacterium]|nr:M48 family metallopeptidase [Candidatus Uhrbacteria bacterium]